MKTAQKSETVLVKNITREILNVNISSQEGIPLVSHRMPSWVLPEMEQKPLKGVKATTKAVEIRHTPQEHFNESLHKLGDEIAIPAMAIKKAMIRAASTLGYEMAKTKCLFYVVGRMNKDGNTVIPINCKEKDVTMQSDLPKLMGGTPKPTYRARIDKWSARLSIRYYPQLIDADALINMLQIAGDMGILEGRANSPNSCGMGWGTFEVLNGKKATEEK